MLMWKEGHEMLSSALFLLIWSVAAALSATPTPLPANGPGVPSPDAGDPGNALLVLVTGLLVLVGIVLITVGIRSARANQRAEDELQQRQQRAEQMRQAPPAPNDSAGHRAAKPASE